MVAAASLATWAYFGLIERLNTLETNQTMMQADLEQNTEFRIKWPRGEMGSLLLILNSLCSLSIWLVSLRSYRQI